MRLILFLQIPNLTLTPSTFYNVTVAANNSLDVRITSKIDTSPPEKPILVNYSMYQTGTNSTLTIKYIFFLQSGNDDCKLDFYIINNNSINNPHLLYSCSVKIFHNFTLTVGNDQNNSNCNNSNSQLVFTSSTNYNFKINITNRFRNKTSSNAYNIGSYEVFTDSKISSDMFWFVLLLFLLVAIVIFVIRYVLCLAYLNATI